MSFLETIKQPPWRTVAIGCGILLLIPIAFVLWSPKLDVRDGRHDRGANGIWIAHGWIGDDAWFVRNNKTNEFIRYRDRSNVKALAARLRAHHITDVFPHLCPADVKGPIPSVDPAQTEVFLDELAGFRVIPWIGGPNGSSARLKDENWRNAFVGSVRALLTSHPRLAGVQLNIEPLKSGDRDFLKLLEELRASLPPGKILSIAAYPPPTTWHQYEEVHWDESYFKEVARRSDQMAVMMYDTALRVQKLYQQLMADWTSEVLAWSEGKRVLLGVPTYADAGVGYHHPHVENVTNALLGIHHGLARSKAPTNYQGIAVYCEWETGSNEWQYIRDHFLKP